MRTEDVEPTSGRGIAAHRETAMITSLGVRRQRTVGGVDRRYEEEPLAFAPSSAIRFIFARSDRAGHCSWNSLPLL